DRRDGSSFIRASAEPSAPDRGVGYDRVVRSDDDALRNPLPPRGARGDRRNGSARISALLLEAARPRQATGSGWAPAPAPPDPARVGLRRLHLRPPRRDRLPPGNRRRLTLAPGGLRPRAPGHFVRAPTPAAGRAGAHHRFPRGPSGGLGTAGLLDPL